MSDNAISITSFVEINEGQEATFRGLIDAMLNTVRAEEGCLEYSGNFNAATNTFVVREMYADAEAVAHHAQNAGAQLGELLAICKGNRVEATGPAEELEKLKAVFEPMGTVLYVREGGFRK